MTTTEENSSILVDSNGGQLALKEVKVRARLHELVAEVEVEQSYVNRQNINIETVYTFPLPIGAVLLGLELEIAGKKLAGQVIERKRAERDYEEAVTDGNSAVLLQETGPGLYTASIGNLMARESAVIRYRYALMLSWQGNKLRLLLPTTIAPRYGNAEAAGLQPHQIPEFSLIAEYPLSLTVLVEGSLASMTIASPTHTISYEKLANGISAKISGQAVLDRDFVLTLESSTAQSSCVYIPDGDEHVAIASLRIPPIAANDKKPLAVKLLIDCSGSMGGTSIVQARKAALEILNALRPTDSFNVTLFGSDFKHLFPHMVPASGKFITQAWNRLEQLDADMGGTEMENALAATFALKASDGSPCILLITDGAVYEHEKLVRRAAASAHRVFTVGVGTAVVDDFLESLAQKTGGACELVSPQEGMSEKILAQFHRLRQPKLEQVQIDWPTTPEWTTPLPQTLFAGDTVHAFAGFKRAVDGLVTLRTAAAGQPLSVTTTPTLSGEKDLPRIAAAHRIKYAMPEEALALSLKYQLLWVLTSYLVVAERDEKAGDLPELHQVPQMLAAGWGGSGSIQYSRSSSVLPSAGFENLCSELSGVEDLKPLFLFESIDPSHPAPVVKRRKYRAQAVADSAASSRAHESSPILSQLTPAEFIAKLEHDAIRIVKSIQLPKTIKALEYLGIPSEDAACLQEEIAKGGREDAVVMAYLYALSASNIGALFGRALKRAILKAWKDSGPDIDLDTTMRTLTLEVSASSWSPGLLVANIP